MDSEQHHVDSVDINVSLGYKVKQPDSEIDRNTKQPGDAERQNEWNTSKLLQSERQKAHSVWLSIRRTQNHRGRRTNIARY